MVIALAASALTWLITGEIIRAVTILVVFCPCALVLATPTAIMAAIGNATHHGFLVREGDALERLARVSMVAFDKTGTLTFGTPQVTAVETVLPELSRQQLYAYAAGAELRSEHPWGKRWYAVTRMGRAPSSPSRRISRCSLPGASGRWWRAELSPRGTGSCSRTRASPAVGRPWSGRRNISGRGVRSST